MRSGVALSVPSDSDMDWDAARAGVEIVSGKWVLSVMAVLTHGPTRYNELSRAVRIDHKRLGRVLRRLLEAQIVAKETNVSRQQVHVRYQLTRTGQELLPLLAALGSWSRDSKA